MPPKTIVILTCIHGRHAVSECMLRHHAAAAEWLRESAVADYRLAAVLSPQDAEYMGGVCDALGVLWMVHENKPVSHKWQAGLQFVHDDGGDVAAVMIAGSDDFLSNAYLADAADIVASGLSLGFGPDRCWMLDAATGRLGLWRKRIDYGIGGITCGAGRVFGRELLERVGWRLWRGAKDRGLDTLCSKRLRKLGYRLDALGMSDFGQSAAIDVKTAENIHVWDSIPYAEVLERPASFCHVGNLGLNCCLDLCQNA